MNRTQLCPMIIHSQFLIRNMKTLKKLNEGKVLTTIVVIFMFSFMTLLSSCTAVVHTPRHPRANVVVVERNVRIDRHDNGLHRGHYKKNEKRKHRDRD